jgi:PAS domain S-box-containing protein
MNYGQTKEELEKRIAELEQENLRLNMITSFLTEPANLPDNYFLIFEKMLTGALIFKLTGEFDEFGIPEFRIVSINDALADLTGMIKEQVVGRLFSEIAPQYKAMYKLVIERVLDLEESNMIEMFDPFLKKNLQIVSFKIKPDVLVLMFNDITEQRKKDKSVEESDNRLKLLAEHVDSVFWLAQRESVNDLPKIMYVSPNLQKLSGYTFDEIRKDADFFLKIIHPEDKERLQQLLVTDTFRQLRILDEEYRIMKKDGTVIWVWARIHPIESQDGIALKMAGIMSDISTRKEIEQELERSKLLLQDIIDNTNNILIYTKSIDNKYELVNRAFCEFVGLSKEEIIGRSESNIFPVEISTKINQFEQDSVTSKRAVFYENHLIYKERDFYFLTTKFPLISPNGEVESICTVGTNISNIRHAENELIKAKEKAEESDKLKSAFLANMSHEIRTPMNSIIGFTEVLMEEVVSDEHQRFLEIIYSSSRHLLMLINDIIDISKIESGQIKTNESHFSVNNLVDELQKIYLSDFEAQHRTSVDLIVKKGLDEELAIIISDDLRLKQILTNLISNAIKFTDRGYVEWGYRVIDDEMLEFYVKDTGIGISQDKYEVIFQRFRQADNSITRKFGGTGLGLAISKGLVELLGGEIWVESSKGQGTCFYFTLPYKKGSLEGVAESGLETFEIQHFVWYNRLILIVEDDINNYYYLKTLLKKTGVNILHAEDGLKAIEIFKNHPTIDLILMDIQLPKLSGAEVTRIIKSIKPQLPIIAQTANAMVEDRALLFAAGCDDYVTKPIKSAVLLRIMDNCLSKKY